MPLSRIWASVLSRKDSRNPQRQIPMNFARMPCSMSSTRRRSDEHAISSSVIIRMTALLVREGRRSRSNSRSRTSPGRDLLARRCASRFFRRIRGSFGPRRGRTRSDPARYRPGQYKSGGWTDLREAALVGLLRSGLLKRFESSVRAFAVTAEKMANAHDVFLEGLGRGVVLTSGAIQEWEQMDNDEAFEALFESEGVETTEGYDLARLRADVKHDRDLLRRFAEKTGRVEAKSDPKLKRLIQELESISSKRRRKAWATRMNGINGK